MNQGPGDPAPGGPPTSAGEAVGRKLTAVLGMDTGIAAHAE